MAEPSSSASPYPVPLCPECRGACLWAQVDSLNWGVRRLGALFSGFSSARALVCSSCGFIRLYALNPAALQPKR
jgi:hypothetical protein